MKEGNWDEDFAVESLKARLLHQLPDLMKVLVAFRLAGVILLAFHGLLARFAGRLLATVVTLSVATFASVAVWNSVIALKGWFQDAFDRLVPHPSDQWSSLQSSLSSPLESIALKDIMIFCICSVVIIIATWLLPLSGR
jgi:hypothetical protein